MFSVVIPNWNGVRYLPTCLDSLRSQRLGDFEIIVVDNASTDGSRELLARDYPEVRLLALQSNRGFTGACNAGIRVAQGAIVVLLNNDTEAAPDWLAEVEAAFQRHSDAGIVASKYCFLTGGTHSTPRGIFSVLTAYLPTGECGKKTPDNT